MFKTCLNSPSHELTRWPVDPLTLTALDPGSTSRPGPIQVPLKGGKKKKKKKRNPKETKNFGKRTFAQKLMHRVSLHCFLCFGILRSFCILQTLHLWSVDRAQHFQDEFASVRNTSAFPQSESTERRELELSGSPCWVGCQISSEFARKHWQIELILQRRWSCKTGWRTRNVFNRNGNGNGRQALLPVELFEIAIFWDGPIDRRQRSLPCPDTWDSWPFKLRVFSIYSI